MMYGKWKEFKCEARFYNIYIPVELDLFLYIYYLGKTLYYAKFNVVALLYI